MSNDQKTYSRNELALRNGQDMDTIWIAFQGRIYDATNSRYWKKGFHYEHWAGQDLSEHFKDAPHTVAVFERLPLVGFLRNYPGI
jgi:predicted heme/steroid binding protein